MIKIDFRMSNIYFNDKWLPLFAKFKKEIQDILFYKEFLFVITSNRLRISKEDYEFNDNVFKFNSKGKLLYRTGSIKMESPTDKDKIEIWEASNMTIKDGYLYLGYSIGYEAWFDIETGELLRGQYENRRF